MRGWHKAVRAVLAATFTTLLALLMHLGAGGDFSFLGAAIVFVMVLWVSMILAGRRMGYLSLGGILGLGQVLMHFSMDWFPGTSTAASGSPNNAGASALIGNLLGSTSSHQSMGHAMSAPQSAVSSLSAPVTSESSMAGMNHAASGMSHAMFDGSSAGSAMLIAHVFAVLITAVVLKRGEDLLLSILQLALGPITTAFIRTAGHVRAEIIWPTTVRGNFWHLPQAVSAAVTCANFRRGPPALV